MATPTYTALATTTLGSDSATVTFSSIPATYRDLVLVINGKTTRSGNSNDVRIQVNADTGNNYSYVQMFGDGSSALSYSGASQDHYPTTFAGTGATASALIHFIDYSATDKHKTFLSRGDSAAWGLAALAGRWANTNAITSIKIYSSVTGDMASGTTFALYGIEA